MSKNDTKKLKIISAALLAAILIGSAAAVSIFYHAADFEYKNSTLPVSSTVPSASDQISTSPSDIGNDTSSDITPEPTEKTETVKYVKITSSVRVRETNSQSSKQVALLDKGDEVKYISENDQKYQVEYAYGKNGWIVKNCGEVFDKTIVIKLLQKYTSGEPIDMSGTDVGNSLDSILKNRNTVGASIAVIQDGKVAYHLEYGYADKKAKTEVTENTKFRIASVTKVFTAMMAMRQVDDGQLDLDGDLSKIMGFKIRNPKYPNTAITERMLLTHTAGLKDGSPIFSGSVRTQLNKKESYHSKPGAKFLYSNLSLGAAGAVLEKCSNQVISEYARDKFFEPMGLDASFDAKYLSDKSLVANCYNGSALSKDNKYLTRSQPWGGPGQTYHLTAGGLLISAEDLASLTTILINNGQYNGQQYLSEKSVNEMLSKQLDTKDFTQCIAIRKKENLVGSRTMYYHNGEAYGIHSLMAFDPNDKSGVIVITSGASAVRNDNKVFAVCDEVMNLCYNEIIEK